MSAAEYLPERLNLTALREAAAGCRGCPLWKDATQTVFGAGPNQRPNAEEIRACRPWLDAELEVVKPQVLVALGATAAKALYGSSFRVSRERGRFIESDLAPLATATVHPSSLLRLDDEDERRLAELELAADLGKVADKLA